MLELVVIMITNTKWQHPPPSTSMLLYSHQKKHTIGLQEERACISNIYYCLTCNTICVDAHEYEMCLTLAQIRPCICCLAGGGGWWMLCDLPPLITTVSNIIYILYKCHSCHTPILKFHGTAPDGRGQHFTKSSLTETQIYNLCH